jgi:hypothetical protein
MVRPFSAFSARETYSNPAVVAGNDYDVAMDGAPAKDGEGQMRLAGFTNCKNEWSYMFPAVDIGRRGDGGLGRLFDDGKDLQPAWGGCHHSR